MPAESGEGMKGTYPICWSSGVAPLPPSHLPLRSYALGYLECPAMSIDDTSSQLPARLPRFCLPAAHVDKHLPGSSRKSIRLPLFLDSPLHSHSANAH